MRRRHGDSEMARLEHHIERTAERIDRLRRLLATRRLREADALPLRSTLVCLEQSLQVFQRNRRHLLR